MKPTPLSTWRHFIVSRTHEFDFWSKLGNTASPFFADAESLRRYKCPQVIKSMELLNEPADAKVRILDVGSGPTSVLSSLANEQVSVFAIDPLAHDYARLQRPECAVVPICIAGEDIGMFFPDEYFHIVWSANAIDHCKCPYYVVQQINAVVKRGGFFCWQFYENEAKREKYTGLHRFNLSFHKGSVFEMDSNIDLLAQTDFEVIDNVSDQEVRTLVLAKKAV